MAFRCGSLAPCRLPAKPAYGEPRMSISPALKREAAIEELRWADKDLRQAKR
ncbi:MAG: hypothetical protein HQ464_06615 [Planctomycetes bacterium]|nr:hypothetical protein [Planctomycetota bacterium]